jgi:hypothetical protein
MSHKCSHTFTDDEGNFVVLINVFTSDILLQNNFVFLCKHVVVSCIKVADEKYENAEHLCQNEIAEFIDEVFANDDSGNELVLCVGESDSELEDARNNDARDTSKPA